MVVFFNKAFVDVEEKAVENEAGVPFTLRMAAVNSLMAAFEDEKSLSGEEKLKRYDLGMRIHKSPDPIEITAEEVSLIKKLIAKGYPTLISAQAWKMVEGAAPVQGK
jgi:hypothetical protein